MKKSRKNRFLGILLSLALVLGLMPGMSLTAWADTTVTWGSKVLRSLVLDECDSKGNSFGGITVTMNGGDGFWYHDNIDFGSSDDMSSFTFTSTVGNITSIVIHAGKFCGSFVDLADGWSVDNASNPSKLSWSGTAAESVILPACPCGIDEISEIVFTVGGSVETTYSVTLTGGANATASGSTSQTDVSGEMQTVTYTANEGYQFPLFDDIESNGVTATRTDDTTVTVSGTPTADASIVIPDAVLTSLPDGKYAQGAVVDNVNYTRFVYVLPLTELAGKKKATFTVTKGDASASFDTSYYYTGMVSSGVTYIPANVTSVMLICNVKGAAPEELTCTLTIDGEVYEPNS